jgi:hypothetical protein
MASFVPFSRCKCLRTYYINQIKQNKLKLKILQNVSQASPSNFTTVGSDSTHLGVIEDFVANEEMFLNGFFNVLSQVRTQPF